MTPVVAMTVLVMTVLVMATNSGREVALSSLTLLGQNSLPLKCWQRGMTPYRGRNKTTLQTDGIKWSYFDLDL